MHLIYIDDSRDEKLCAFSALTVAEDEWRNVFKSIRNFRKELKVKDGIYIYKEFHAWKFISGRGNISDRIVPKGRRCQIFKEALQLLSESDGVRLFNAVFPANQEEKAFEWLLNRINKTMHAWSSNALLICDEGKNAIYTRLTRKMGVYNPLPSKYGTWTDSGEVCKNLPIDRIIEDPFFKQSDQSYFIQLADFCAYALLRFKNPMPSKTKYGIHEAFYLLIPILVFEARRKDDYGIISP